MPAGSETGRVEEVREDLMIQGIGGVFLFSNDTKRLVTWYRDCLGIVAEGQGSESDSIYKTFIEKPEIKRTMVWAIIPTKQDIKDKPRTGRINYLVKNLGEVLSHLKSKGVAIEKTAEDPYGNFAWVRDPDGNQIELWEPSESV